MKRRWFGGMRRPTPEPLDRGQAFFGDDLDDLVESGTDDFAWLTTLLRGAAELTSRGCMPQGQLLQDALAVGIATLNSTPHAYLEIGGGPPRDHSNTYALDQIGWHGTVVEPNPTLADDYRTTRSARTRLLQVAVTTSGLREVDFINAGELSYVSDGSAPPDDMWAPTRERALARGRIHRVSTIAPESLWADTAATTGLPSFLSLDVEGSELQILHSLPMTEGAPYLVCVEHSGDTLRSEAQEALMNARGYTRILRRASKWDGWFVRDVSPEPTPT